MSKTNHAYCNAFDIPHSHKPSILEFHYLCEVIKYYHCKMKYCLVRLNIIANGYILKVNLRRECLDHRVQFPFRVGILIELSSSMELSFSIQ